MSSLLFGTCIATPAEIAIFHHRDIVILGWEQQHMPIIQFAQCKKRLLLGKVIVPAVKVVSFSIERGDFVSIAGPSGRANRPYST